MFGFNRKPKQMTEEQYQQEFKHLQRELGEQFSIGNSPYEELLYAMGVIDHEMNSNGGCNWVESNFIEYLDTLREYLSNEPGFSPEQLAKVRWSLDEITACGRELEAKGESGRNATEAVDYLILRAVDWCRMHPRKKNDD
jgi:hypothetical protein